VEQVNKMDSVFKKCVTSTLKELEGVAKNAAKEEMKGLDGLVGRQMGLDDWEAVVPI
jgi:phage tail tape-measure protein